VAFSFQRLAFGLLLSTLAEDYFHFGLCLQKYNTGMKRRAKVEVGPTLRCMLNLVFVFICRRPGAIG
jgi:hypothetical protein